MSVPDGEEIMAVLSDLDAESNVNEFHDKLFRYIRQCFEEQRYCDVTIFGTGETEEGKVLKGIKCHSIVLCSVAPIFKPLLLERDIDEREIFLPDISFEDVSKFITDIYQESCSINSELLLKIRPDLANVLGYKEEGGSSSSEVEEKDIKPKKMVQVVVENKRAVQDHRQFQLIIPEAQMQDGKLLLNSDMLVS